MSRRYTFPAEKADKHLLYQWSVQDPEQELDFVVQQYVRRRRRQPKVLREDFCGTALVACHWVKGHPRRRAIGLDLDADTLAWARRHNLAPLGADARRVDLRQKDVRTVTRPAADIVLAMNFSYYVFFPLAELIKYFRVVRRSLAPGGLFVLDCYGGWDSQQVIRERRTIDTPDGSFAYIWDQADFDPINNRTVCHIHFELKDGKRLNKAFTYDWRLYSPAEVRDALAAAGFAGIEVFWDFEEDEDASDYRPAQRAENCPGWIAYVVAERNTTPRNGRA